MCWVRVYLVVDDIIGGFGCVSHVTPMQPCYKPLADCMWGGTPAPCAYLCDGLQALVGAKVPHLDHPIKAETEHLRALVECSSDSSWLQPA